MHGSYAIDDRRRSRPARRSAPMTTHPTAPPRGRGPVRATSRSAEHPAHRATASGHARAVAALR